MKFLKELEIVAIFFVIYIVLSESVEPFALISGVIASIATLKVTNKLLGLNYTETFYLSLPVLIWYIFYILKEIYLAGFDMLKRIVTGNVHPTFVEHESELQKPMSLLIFSNSITLTPGSATVWRNGAKMLVLSSDKEVESVQDSLQSMEKSLQKLERAK